MACKAFSMGIVTCIHTFILSVARWRTAWSLVGAGRQTRAEDRSKVRAEAACNKKSFVRDRFILGIGYLCKVFFKNGQ